MWIQNILLKYWFHYGPFIGTKPGWLILLMAENFAPVEVGSLAHYLQGFIHSGWLVGFQPSTVSLISCAFGFGEKISENISTEFFFEESPCHLSLVISCPKKSWITLKNGNS